MLISVKRKQVQFRPDFTRVIARFFMPGKVDRAQSIIRKVINLPDETVHLTLNQVLRNFSKRHRNISKVFKKHFDKIKYVLDKTNIDPKSISLERKLLIGSYFTTEYAIESAAFFNPSIVEHPDQSGLDESQKRVIVSFRATGEGHISSIVFRCGIIDKNDKINFEPPGRLVDLPEVV